MLITGDLLQSAAIAWKYGKVVVLGCCLSDTNIAVRSEASLCADESSNLEMLLAHEPVQSVASASVSAGLWVSY